MDTRVLVVDDEMETLNLMRIILTLNGYIPITTLNSLEAITLAETEKPDVVLLDIMMPGLDGFELCKLMRQNPATKNLPIAFVTAYEMLDMEARRLEAGADLVVHKPVNMKMLAEAIPKIIELRAS